MSVDLPIAVSREHGAAQAWETLLYFPSYQPEVGSAEWSGFRDYRWRENTHTHLCKAIQQIFLGTCTNLQAWAYGHTTETNIDKYIKMCSPKQKYMPFDLEVSFLGSCPKDRIKDVYHD